MLALLVVALISVALTQWLLQPLVLLLTPLLDLSWLGWAALAVLLWLLAGAAPDPAAGSPLDRSGGGAGHRAPR
ncbi:MAG: hypothetical protein VKN15_03515 [Cyanobacteriota bacterium]|nr:hypothetical protein [Cyanobacteriota bacterium]